MRFLLLANLLFEGILGAIMIYNPAILFTATDVLVISLARSVGFTSCVFAVLSGLLIKYSENREVLSVGLLIFLLFHIGFAYLNYLSFSNGISPIQVVVIHGVFASGFLYYFSRN